MMNKHSPKKNKTNQSMQNSYQAALNDSPQKTIEEREPKEQIDVIFDNITYSVTQNDQEKFILRNVTGIFKAGQMSAILGQSGAGKTSLLNILACRISAHTGNRFANTLPYDQDNFGEFACYIMQNDILLQTLSVRQTLMFAADLKINRNTDEKVQTVDRLIKSLKLQRCKDTLIGGPLVKGVSGGQKKRTSIAFELIGDPKVIMLDQPTSGLDSLTSFIIIDYLKKLAHNQHKTVIMTIHQPSKAIYDKFDFLVLMKNGFICYQGPTVDAIPYFNQHFRLVCPEFENPAQFLIQALYMMSDNAELRQQHERRLQQVYNEQLLPIARDRINRLNSNYVHQQNLNIKFTYIFRTLLKRDGINMWRNPLLLKARFAQTVIIGLLIGGLYFGDGQTNYLDQISWQTITGMFFLLSIASLLQSLAPIVISFPMERPIFLKEQNSKLYKVLPYFLSRNVIDLPYLIVIPLLFTSIFYYMAKISNTGQQFFLFYFILLLSNFNGSSLGLLIGSVINEPKSVAIAVPIVIIPFMLFSGFFKNRTNIPMWADWFQFISPIKYIFAGLTQNQMKYRNSYIDKLNFGIDFQTVIGSLIGLSIGYRLLSLLFLYALRTKLQ